VTGSDLSIILEFHLEGATQVLNIVDKTDYDALGLTYSNIEGVIKVVDPNETVVYDNTDDFTSPDIALSSSRKSGDITLTTNDDTNEVVEGEYEVIYKIQHGSDEYTKTITKDYSYSRPSVDLDVTIDGYSSTYQADDNTSYNALSESYINNVTQGQFTTLNSSTPYEGVIQASEESYFASDGCVVIYTSDVDSGTICYIKSITGDNLTVISGTNLYTTFNKTTTYNIRNYTRRTFAVTPPAGSGMSSQSTGSSQLTYSANIYSGDYAATITTKLVKNHATDLYIYETVTGSSTDHAYNLDIEDIRSAASSLDSALETARSDNRRTAESLENIQTRTHAQFDIYQNAVNYGNNQAAYNAIVEMYTLLNDYVDTTSDPEEITPFNAITTYTDEKVKTSSSDSTADYLINKMYSSHFEEVDNEVRIKSSGLSALQDYVSASDGGSFDSLISYSSYLAPSGDREIPDIGWVKSQSYITTSDLSVATESGSGVVGTPLTYSGGVFSLDTDLSQYDNSTSSFITGNETITLTGDITGSGTTAITTTLANDSVEYNHLNDNIISSQTEVTGSSGSGALNLDSDDEMLVDSNGIKRVGVDTLKGYMENNVSYTHNDLSSIQGGSSTERYHMTASQKAVATRIASDTQSGLISSTDWDTFNSKQDALSTDDTITLINDELGVSISNIIDDSSTTTSNLWSASKTQTEISSQVSDTIGSRLSYVNARQDPDNPTTLDPGSNPDAGVRYIIEDANNLNANFGTINLDSDGASITLQDDDVVECESFSGSGSVSGIGVTKRFVVATDVSELSSTAKALVGSAVVNGSTVSDHIWYYNLTEWIDYGKDTLHEELTDLNPTGLSAWYHLSQTQLNALTQNNSSIDLADNYHKHTNATTYDFQDSDLDSSDEYEITHVDDVQYPLLTLYDNNGNYAVPGFCGVNVSRITAKKYKVKWVGNGTLPGTWYLTISGKQNTVSS
jgi:hypothetical protein